jgi:hypothetical protein
MLTLTMLEQKKKILIYNLTQVISTYFIIKIYNRVKIDKGIINTPIYVSFLQISLIQFVIFVDFHIRF